MKSEAQINTKIRQVEGWAEDTLDSADAHKWELVAISLKWVLGK